MKQILILLATALLTACSSKPQFGSDCTTSEIKILQSRSQQSATTIIEPFISTKSNGVLITVGKYDAYRIITARSKEDPIVSRAISMLRPLLDQLPTNGKATDAAQIYPRLSELKGKELTDGVTISNEINVLFVRALKEGAAQIIPAPYPPITLVEYYTASVPLGPVNGVRIMLSGKRIYDYCVITPPKPN
jgi:hypothetical protein